MGRGLNGAPFFFWNNLRPPIFEDMIQLESGTKDYVITPRDIYPHGNNRAFQITLKSRATGEVKTAKANQSLFTYGQRACKLRLIINSGATEDLDLGIIDLQEPDFPAGYYSYIVYQLDTDDSNPQFIDLGVALLSRDSDEKGFVEFEDPDQSLTFNVHEP